MAKHAWNLLVRPIKNMLRPPNTGPGCAHKFLTRYPMEAPMQATKARLKCTRAPASIPEIKQARI